MSELTRREREVAKLIALDMSTKRIATELGIRYHTAKVHRHRIKQKLSGGTAKITLYAVRTGLINVNGKSSSSIERS